MADDVRTLMLQIDATTQLLRSNLAAAEAAVADFARDTDQKLGQVDGRFASVGKGLTGLKAELLAVKSVAAGALAALGLGVGIGSLASLGRDALDYASSLGEAAQQMGVTTDQLQVFRYAASQVGVSQEEMDKGLAKLTRTLGEAQTGSATAAKLFATLGISIRNADGSARAAGDVLPLIAEALSQIPEPAKRAAVEVDLFGKAGQKLDTLLSGGRGAIDEMTRAARSLGLVIDEQFIARADAAADKLAELKMILEARIATVVAENSAAIYNLADSLVTLTAKIPDTIRGLRELGLQAGEIQAGTLSNLTFGWLGEGVRGRLREARRQLESEGRISDGERRYQQTIGSVFPTGDRFDPSRPFVPRTLTPPRLSGLDTLNASAGGRGGGRKKEVDELQKQIDDLNKSAIAAINNLDRIEIGGEEKRVASNTKWFSTDDYDNIVKQIEARRDQEMNLFTMRKEEEAEIARIREGHIYELSNLYEDLFRGGTSALWRDFKSMGIRAVAEVMARLAAGDSFKSAVGNVFSASNHGAGGTLAGIAGLFGGFFAGGGSPPVGRVSIVGERGPELFVPKVPGTIIPNGGWGGGQQAVTVYVEASEDFNVRMDRRAVAVAAPMAQQAVVGGAALAQERLARRRRRMLA